MILPTLLEQPSKRTSNYTLLPSSSSHHQPASINQTEKDLHEDCEAVTSSSTLPTSLILHMDRYKPLPSILIDFIAITLCDIIPFRRPQRKPSKSSNDLMSTGSRHVPELVYFIQKITCQARINCRTALVALIYLDRAKAALPRNAVGSFDTCHRMLLGALLLASKYLQDSDWSSSCAHTSSAFAPSAASSICSSHHCRPVPLTNWRLYTMSSALFTLEDINQLERAFLKLIQYRCWLDDKDIHTFVLRHRTDLAL